MSETNNSPPNQSTMSANEKSKEVKRQRPSFADSVYGSNNEGSGATNIQVNATPIPASSTTISPSANSSNQTPFGSVPLSESALAQRRSAYLPKLRQLSSNPTNLSFEQGAYRNEMGEINFVYADCDTFAVELSELYSYSEMHEWAINLDSFTSYMRSKNLSPVWMGLEKREKQTVLADLVQSLEQTSATERLETARILLYILQGAFADFEEPYSEVVADSMEEARSNIQSNNEEEFLENFCLLQSACNAYLAYEAGLFKSLCEALLIEANEATDEHASYAERGQSSLSNTRSVSSTDGVQGNGSGETKGRRPVTINENEMLRTTLSCLYHIVESIRRQEVLAKCTHVSDYSASHLEQLQQQFLKELREPIDCVDKPLLLFLLDLIPPFIRGACVKVPIKKVILLAWKVLLATFGGIATLRDLKAQKRRDADLPAVEDTISVAIKMRSTNFSTDGQFAESTGTKVQRRYRGGIARGAFNRQKALTTTQLSDDSSSPRDDEKLPDEEDIGAMPQTQPSMDNQTESEEDNSVESNQQYSETTRECDTPAPTNGGQRTPNGGERTPTATSPLPNLLPWTSKVRQCEVEQFIQNERMKFCGYKLPRDGVSLFGLPAPVIKSVEALRRHVYVSLGEKQIAEEKLLNKYPFSRKETPYESPIENIYTKMIPNLPTDSICFLKVLLAAIPSTKIQTKSDSAHILADVLTGKCPETSDLLSASLNLDVSVSSHNVLEDAIRLAIDINRHKEIIVKATTALILGLLKFFRLSHVYEFENLSQQLVLTNCLPLILKFLDQNMVKYFQSKNELAPLCFPKAVVHYARNKREWPILNADNVGADQADNQSYFLWRNVFASVNLLRILNKLTKNKHSRTMMLVVFKSTPILKRCLKLRSGIFQFYTLKLLKMQARYLGRQWRRTNMDIISAIYMKLRHRLNDDWAFANETRCKSWDFQAEERQLKSAIERFNMRRYGYLYPDLALQMDVKDSISGVAGANAGKLLGATEGDQEENNDPDDEPEESEEDFDPSDYIPVDNNLCSILGEQVEFTPHFKRNYEKWMDEVVFRHPVNWDNVIMDTAKLEIRLKQEA